jgi:hypothetical protein
MGIEIIEDPLNVFTETMCFTETLFYRGVDKSLTQPNSLSIVFYSPGNRW